MTIQTAITAGVTPAADATPIWRDGAFGPDAWTVIADDAALPAEGGVIVSVKRYCAEAAAGTLGNKPVGVKVEPADKVAALKPYLDAIPLIAVDFPKFNDGRGFSHAALLVRAGYRGELRAVGNVLIDQLTMMRRVGFTSFAVSHPVTRRYLAEGRNPNPTRFYQPAALPEPPAGTRPFLRRAGEPA